MSEEPKVYEARQPMGLQVESREEMLVRLNWERQVANNKQELRKVNAKVVLSVLGLVALTAATLKFIIVLFSINLS